MSEYKNKLFEQYSKVKEKYPEHILGFKLGEFYEFFFLDAKIVATECDLIPTGRTLDGERFPMTSYPIAAEEKYRTQLMSKGYKIIYLTEEDV